MKKVKSSLDSIERVGSKLTMEDFREFLQTVADTLPSGTEEYEFLASLLLDEKTDLGFVKKLFTLIDERPEITDSSPYGFSWELQSPTELGKIIFPKLEEVDTESAHDLYEFMSFQYMENSSKMQEDTPNEHLDTSPEDVDSEFGDAAVAKGEPTTVSASDGSLKVVSYLDGETFLAENPDFAKSADLSAEIIDVAIARGGAVYMVTSADKSAAWNKEVGFVTSDDSVLSPEAAFELFGADILSSGLPQTAFPEELIKSAKPEFIRPVLVTDTDDPQRVSKMMQILDIGTIVAAIGRAGKSRQAASGTRADLYASVLSKPRILRDSKNEPWVRVMWSNGTTEEIPVSNIMYIMQSDRPFDNGAKMVLLSSFRKVEGKVSFVVTSFRQAKKSGTYHQTFSGKVTLTEDEFKSSNIQAATRVYAGAALGKLAKAFPKSENAVVACRAPRIIRTFVSEKAAVIVQSGPYGMFAHRVPVAFVKSAKRYVLFKKIGASYLSSTGHRFKAIKAAKFGKPKYLMVASSDKQFFVGQPGRITCNAYTALKARAVVSQRRRVQAAIHQQRKAVTSALKRSEVIASQAEEATKALADKEVQLTRQNKLIDTLNTRILANRNAGLSSSEEGDKGMIKSTVDTDRLARLMSRL
jgi:hypothetical protein